ncbi:helix-turn-helix domain-containing protein [Flammeovirga yaeyamensis]|uniref:Helix-turn-helix domain-containing protein n=1 Tax=Flammeovirga yaeyamensis TaxID=367791 RepID=A0AAX1N5K1_9BACT|nr:AraC family transcriptional regulator [Flammeovirga yaeyamensis]MBB3698493.1 AraC-like DNA-binding protein [Flammeovirga yaeyamensis]NMF34158.1 AraC family transcriptional regulator [Flammeovirga yaeyamensis]QWG01143.1 helix-turn-helix domain-containing protein [Flammeovirga yaeyamensis]
MKEINFKSITEFTEAQNLPEPENPLFTIGQKTLNDQEIEDCVSSNKEFSYTNQFYLISLKRIVSGEILYGRTKYDCSKGTLLFSAPNQTYKVKDIVVSSESWFLAFHEDFIRGEDIQKLIKKYNYFNYNVNEALHLSPKEEATIKSIFKNIETEYQNNQDEFSKDIILTHLEALLKYADRFYKRQFLNRKDINKALFTRFKEMLNEYFENDRFEQEGMPSMEWLAAQLGVSHRYMRDTIKAETGRTAIDQINLFVIEEAKNLLLAPKASVSATAYKLGFEYPQYFSRMFKKKTGITPKEYIESVSMN